MQPNRARLFAILFSTCLVAISASGTIAGAGLGENEKTLAEYLKGLELLAEQDTHIRGEAVYTSVKGSAAAKGEVGTRTKVKFAFSGKNGRMSTSGMPGDDKPQALKKTVETSKKATQQAVREVVHVFNQDRSFMLQYKDGTPGPLIRWMDNDPKVGSREIFRSIGCFIQCSSYIGTSKIKDFLKLEGLRVDQVGEVPIGTLGQGLRIGFSIPLPPKIIPRINYPLAGWMDVSPHDSWVLCGYGITHGVPGEGEATRVAHIEYTREASGRPLPVRVEMNRYRGRIGPDADPAPPQSSLISMESLRFERLEYGDSPDRDFTLAAFGLPEFGQTVAQASAARSYPWWLLGSAVALVGVAFGLWRLAKRLPARPGEVGHRPG